MLTVDEMVATEDSLDIHEFGTVVDKGRVKCNYCGKVVTAFYRLRYHLSGIPKDVIPCPAVPPNIRNFFKNDIEKSIGTVKKAGVTNGHSDSPLKRHVSPCKIKSNSMAHTSIGVSKKRRKVDSSSERSPRESTSFPDSGDVPQVAPSGHGDSSLKELQKSILRFFCETRLDLSAVNSHSFREMIESALRHGQLQCEVPNFQGLKQCLLQDALGEMKQYVKEVRSSWASTGCSILLDGWTDSKGRDLVNVLVDCPSGAIYLRSVDLSSLIGDVNAIQGLLEDILEDVGLDNVVQIIADSTPTCMQEVGKKLMKKHRTWYWTVCTSRCLEIMLDKFMLMNSFRETLEKAKSISRFIYRNADGLKLVGNHTCLNNLVHPSKIRSIMTFCTLESILLKETDLRSFFTSSDWNTSNLASTEDGKKVNALVLDENFWMTVHIMIKSAIPLVRVLEIFDSEITPQLGRVYDIMDQAKEAIKKEFKGKKSEYTPFWKIIDEIWDNYLYTPLHSSGYFLNPHLFYCEDFHLDPEVTTGLLHCVTRMGGSHSSLDLVVDQTDEYRMAKGKFGPGSASKDLTNLTPEKWWSKYGDHCPELQKLAIRILSQTCNGGSKYNLKMTLAEMIFEQGINPVEQQRLSEQAFVYYNMHLQDFAPNVGNYLTGGELDPMNDWIMEKPLLSMPKPEHTKGTGDDVSLM
ncbi:hypothetical protein Leryth_010189 [Lithospermum erythrorhizon]|nr:hypothetical protein Leryth_010189 [Lithospermum erythrorhizon]